MVSQSKTEADNETSYSIDDIRNLQDFLLERPTEIKHFDALCNDAALEMQKYVKTLKNVELICKSNHNNLKNNVKISQDYTNIIKTTDFMLKALDILGKLIVYLIKHI